MLSSMPTVLEGIVTARRGHLPAIRERLRGTDPAALPTSTRSLFEALRAPGGPHFIMECKAASPSLGMIRKDYRPGAIARVYSRYAAAISVLCEPERFRGDYDHLATVAASTHLPVLCKDFIIDEVQVHAARAFGADAILLMLSVLDDATYRHLQAEAHRLGMDVLTEVIDEEEVRRATALGANIFGINHRNLHDLSIDLSRSGRLAALVPPGAVVVSESGIKEHRVVRELAAHSHAFLVGSHLTGQPDIDAAARSLVYGNHKVCGLRTPAAAQVARAVGARYGGLIFEGASPRNVSRETSATIIAAEPDLEYVAASRRTEGWAELVQPGIRAVQIHAPLRGSADEERELVAHVRREVPEDVAVWRAISMTTPGGPEIAGAIAGDVDRLVLDSGEGGTGTTFDWARVPASVLHRSLLAGGIGPHNVADALRVGCDGLDLNSGVEYQPNVSWAHQKNAAALRQTFRIIRTDHQPPSTPPHAQEGA